MSLSGKGRRSKGVRGEREVDVLFESHGFTVRSLEATGDHLVMDEIKPVFHLEVKRQERLRLPEWLRQAEAEAPPGFTPLVCFRQSRGRWYAALALEDLIEAWK